LKLVDVLNALIYSGPTTLGDLAKILETNKVKVKRAIKKLEERNLVEKVDGKSFDVPCKILSAIVQRRVRSEDLLEIIGKRKPQYTEHLKLLGNLNELHQELLGERPLPKFKFLKLPSKVELEIGEKPLEEAIADAFLSILADLVFNIPHTDVKRLAKLLSEAKGEAKEIAIEILRKFYLDVSREYQLLRRILEAVGED